MKVAKRVGVILVLMALVVIVVMMSVFATSYVIVSALFRPCY